MLSPSTCSFSKQLLFCPSYPQCTVSSTPRRSTHTRQNPKKRKNEQAKLNPNVDPTIDTANQNSATTETKLIPGYRRCQEPNAGPGLCAVLFLPGLRTGYAQERGHHSFLPWNGTAVDSRHVRSGHHDVAVRRGSEVP